MPESDPPDWQQRFAAALRGHIDPQDHLLHMLAAQPGFAVYRNTVHKGCIDALEANFPTVATLVGREWFRSAAAAYVARQWPTEAVLQRYGDADFGRFVQQLPTAAGLPYLAGVALLDSCWRAAHAAADAAVLQPAALAQVDPQALAALVLHPHPAARWAWFAEGPVAGIWHSTRAGSDPGALPWSPDGALITRPDGAVEADTLEPAGCAFLDACAAGQPLAEAADHAQATDPQADIAGLFARLLRAGAFDARSLGQDTP